MTLYLYRKSRWAVTLALSLALAPMLAAQWRAPRPERKTPRAVAVLESSAGGAQRLIPVSFFYQHRYYDANLYRATPVPFTLASETVYEVQAFGKPLGTFTVHGASRAAVSAWFGSGYFKAAPASEAANKKPLAPVVVRDPKRPVLHRRAGSEGDRALPTGPGAQQREDDDPDRPRLHRTEEDNAPQSVQAEAPDSAADSDTSGHPILRRGKPAQEQSGGDLPTTAEAAQPVLRQVAVSDAGSSEPRDLLFACAEPERKTMEARARELAISELKRLAPERGLRLPPSASTVAANEQGAATLPGVDVQEEQFVPYDLDYSDYATVVYSARYRLAADTAAGAQSWVVIIVARRDGDKLTKLYSAVSDPRELDLYPEVRLVDAVDPDGYGRYALLLREQRRDAVSWLLGRVTGYELQTLFETAAR